ncbi:MAG TPA: hypothetical protein VMA83_10435 [Solirubrobacteraceae bacterium]|nr:hypothetical protein [Solirubrobacteraceae bacterium]
MRGVIGAAAFLTAAALAAAPAIAHKTETPNPHRFTGTAAVAPRFVGEEQELTLKPFVVTCEKAKSTKATPAASFPSSNLAAVVKFGECTATGTIAKTEYELEARVSAITVNYHANGALEMGSGGTIEGGKLVGAGPIKVSMTGAVKCTISLAAGAYPAGYGKRPQGEFEAATFSDNEETLGSGKHERTVGKLEISTELGKLPYTLEGPFCETLPKTEMKSGVFTGSLEASIHDGSIGWE